MQRQDNQQDTHPEGLQGRGGGGHAVWLVTPTSAPSIAQLELSMPSPCFPLETASSQAPRTTKPKFPRACSPPEHSTYLGRGPGQPTSPCP